MRRIRKASALLLAVLMLLSLSACGSFGTRAARAAAKMSALESLHMDLDVQLGLKLSLLGRDMDMGMSMTGGTDMQRSPMRMLSDMTVEVIGVKQKMLNFMERREDGYMVSVSTDGGATWSERLTSPEEAPGQMNLKECISLFADCADSFEKVGVEKVMGSEADRYDGEIPGEELGRAMELCGLRDMLSANMGVELEEEALENLGDIPASVWIDKDSGMVTRFDLDLGEAAHSIVSGVLDQLLQNAGIGGIGLKPELESMTVKVLLSRFDKLGEVTRPGA